MQLNSQNKKEKSLDQPGTFMLVLIYKNLQYVAKVREDFCRHEKFCSLGWSGPALDENKMIVVTQASCETKILSPKAICPCLQAALLVLSNENFCI